MFLKHTISTDDLTGNSAARPRPPDYPDKGPRFLTSVRQTPGTVGLRGTHRLLGRMTRYDRVDSLLSLFS